MDFRETSKILTLFTREKGKIPLMAQGVRKKNSKTYPLVNLFSIGDYELNKGKSFYYLKDGSLVQSGYFASSSIDLLTTMSLVCELLDSFIREGIEEYEVYELTEGFFLDLKKDRSQLSLRMISYMLKFISFLGFRPKLTSCLSCDKREAAYYSPSYLNGGFICSNCRETSFGEVINRKDLLLLNRLLYLPTREISQIDIEGQDERLKKLFKITLTYIKYSFDKEKLNSEKWLKKIDFI